ncbi:hypothetical protein [Xanthomonas campestris]|uniref:hypothetical protein n=1 Tax=Xanthomonas campestris TaxID=339 RepID=UPI001E462AA6|nr:hypothetical protein [Xanthomonas campestris]MCC5048820.1 hypothetical protein [Xanthomonas campestris]MCC5057139.1 hypothetical protein [Xanthomonas campestris]MCC5061196.1 hypothetical protein [Xanthomonas campestris]
MFRLNQSALFRVILLGVIGYQYASLRRQARLVGGSRRECPVSDADELLSKERVATVVAVDATVASRPTDDEVVKANGSCVAHTRRAGFKKFISGLNVFGACLLAFLVVVASILFYFIRGGDFKLVVDYGAYVLPLLAALAGGMGIYFEGLGWVSGKRKATRMNVICYQSSVFMLFMGLMCYMSLKVGGWAMFWVALGSLGSICGSALVAVNNKRIAHGPSPIDLAFRPVALGFLALSLVISVAWFYVLASQDIPGYDAFMSPIVSKLAGWLGS